MMPTGAACHAAWCHAALTSARWCWYLMSFYAYAISLLPLIWAFMPLMRRAAERLMLDFSPAYAVMLILIYPAAARFMPARFADVCLLSAAMPADCHISPITRHISFLIIILLFVDISLMPSLLYACHIAMPFWYAVLPVVYALFRYWCRAFSLPAIAIFHIYVYYATYYACCYLLSTIDIAACHVCRRLFATLLCLRRSIILYAICFAICRHDALCFFRCSAAFSLFISCARAKIIFSPYTSSFFFFAPACCLYFSCLFHMLIRWFSFDLRVDMLIFMRHWRLLLFCWWCLFIADALIICRYYSARAFRWCLPSLLPCFTLCALSILFLPIIIYACLLFCRAWCLRHA